MFLCGCSTRHLHESPILILNTPISLHQSLSKSGLRIVFLGKCQQLKDSRIKRAIGNTWGTTWCQWCRNAAALNANLESARPTTRHIPTCSAGWTHFVNVDVFVVLVLITAGKLGYCLWYLAHIFFSYWNSIFCILKLPALHSRSVEYVTLSLTYKHKPWIICKWILGRTTFGFQLLLIGILMKLTLMFANFPWHLDKYQKGFICILLWTWGARK